MDKLKIISESNTYYKIKPSNTFLKNFHTNTQNDYDDNLKKKFLKISTSKNNENGSRHGSKIRVIPSIIDKKDLLLNKNKTLLNIKDLISNKIQILKLLAKDKKEHRNKNNYHSEPLCENNLNDNKCKITNQQIFIQSNNVSNEMKVDFESKREEEYLQNEVKDFREYNEIEYSEVAEIKNKFLGSPKLRNTTALIDSENDLKRLHLNSNSNHNNNNFFYKNESKLVFKNKTSDNFFLNKTRNQNISIILSSHNKNNEEEQRKRSQSIKLINRDSNSKISKHKSAGSVSDFNIKNFNPESQVYFNSEFFAYLGNLYPINLKKDYNIEPSKKMKSENNKTTSMGTFRYFPNRKNNNSILYKMRNSEPMEIQRNIPSSSIKENKVSFNFMNPQIMDFFEFESKLNLQKRSFEKHICNGSFKNQDASSKKEKLDTFRTQLKSGSGTNNNFNNHDNYSEKLNFKRTSVNSVNNINNNNKINPKQGVRVKDMNGDLTCFSNVKIYNNIKERVENAKISCGDRVENCTSERNINEVNSNKYNSFSNTYSDPNDNLIKSKNGLNNFNENNNTDRNNGQNLYAIGKENEVKEQINLNMNHKEKCEKMDFQALNINLNFSQISCENIHNNDAITKRSKGKLASMNLENENNLFENKHNANITSGKKDNLNNYYDITRNSNDNYDDKIEAKNYQEYEDFYYAQSFNKMGLDEINNPLIIEKYEIKNLEKGNFLRLSNGKISYLPFQKSFNVEKIHFNFSSRCNHTKNKNINNNNNYFNSTDGFSRINYNPGKTEGLKNFNNDSKRLIILKK